MDLFNDFLVFVAPVLTIIAAIILAFLIVRNDDAVRDDEE
jgi:hypothetical protein